MKPDAKLRMEVYREGQLAFNANLPCPYIDWRAGTWRKGYEAAKAYHELPFGIRASDGCLSLVDRLRAVAERLRRTPMPISELIPLLQEAADELELK